MKIAELTALVGFETDDASKNKVDESLESFTKGFNGLKAAVAGFVGVLATGFIARQINQVSQHAESLLRTSQAVGLTTDAVQELSFAFQQNGASADLVDRAIRRVTTSSESAAQGNQGLIGTYQQLGISMQDLDSMGPDETFMRIAGGISGMKDEQDALNAAVDLFGTRMATDLMPVLREGEDGLQAVRDRAHELGLVFDSGELGRALEFNNAMGEFSSTIEALKMAFVIDLLPALTEVMDEMTTFVQLNRDFLTQGMRQAVDALGFTFRIFLVTLKEVTDIFDWFQESVGGTENAIRLLILVMGSIAFAKLIVGFKALGVAGLVAWVKMLAPILLVSAALIAIGLLIDDFFASMRGDGALLESMFADGESAILKAAAAVGVIITAIIVLIGLIFGWPIALAIALAALVVLVVAQWDTIKEATLSGLSAMWDGIVGFYEGTVEKLADLIEWFVDSFMSFAEWCEDLMTGLASRIFLPFHDSWDDFIESFRNAFLGAVSFIQDQIDRLIGGFDSMVEGGQRLLSKLPGVELNSPNKEDGIFPALVGEAEDIDLTGESIVAQVMGGGLKDPSMDAQADRHRRESQRSVDESVNIDSDITIEGSSLSREQLSAAVQEGLISAADLAKANNDFEGSPE